MNLWTKYKDAIIDLRYGFVVFVFFIVVSVFIYQEVNDVVELNIEQEYTAKVNEIVREIEFQISDYSNSILSVKGLFSASDKVDRNEWHIFIQNKNIAENFPAIRAYEYIEKVFDNEIDLFEDSVISEGFENFNVYPGGLRDPHFIVNYIEPFDSNKDAFGFDVSSNKERYSALEYARDTKDFAISSPITLIQDTETKGFLQLLAVYDNDLPNNTLDERRQNIVGVVLAVIEYKKLFELISDRVFGIDDFHVLIYDETENIYDNLKIHEQDLVESDPDLLIKNYIDFGGRIWEVEVYPTNSFFERFSTQLNLPLIALYGGLSIGFLVMFFIFSLSRGKRKASRLAKEMEERFELEKKTVKEKNTNLRKNLNQIEKQKKDLEKQKKDLQKLNSLMIGRELTMVDLKNEVKKLKGEKRDEA